jgi:hypothetical protein
MWEAAACVGGSLWCGLDLFEYFFSKAICRNGARLPILFPATLPKKKKESASKE